MNRWQSTATGNRRKTGITTPKSSTPRCWGSGPWIRTRACNTLHEAMQDWGERRGDPSRRPVCMTCPHEFQVNARMPSAWMFVRLSVNKAGVPKQMILVGICEKCAVKDDVTLLREGFAELRRAFPDMPEFKVHVVQQWSGVVN